MIRRALTLLELMIAVAVVLAIASLVMPAVLSRLTATRDEEARVMIDSTIIEARADAARSGVPVRVVAHEAADGRIQIIHEPMREDEDADAPAPAEVVGMEDEARADVERARGSTVRVTLPPGCSFVLRSRLVSLDSIEALDEEAPEARAPDRTIAIVLPDGGAIAGTALALRTPFGRVYEMAVGTWTGGATFERWDPEAALEAPGARGVGVERP